jgi:hypothetical protein
MNILQVQDRLKGLSEQQLATEMQSPSGVAPQFLVLTELQRRKRVRDDFQAQSAKAPATTVAQDAVAAAGVPQAGIAPMARALAPKTDVTQNTGIASLPAAPTPEQPQQMAGGGMVRKMAEGSLVRKMETGEPIVLGGRTYTQGRDGIYRDKRGNVLQTAGQDLAGITSLPYDMGKSLAGYSANLANQMNERLTAQDRANLAERVQGQRVMPATTGYTYPDVPVEDMGDMAMLANALDGRAGPMTMGKRSIEGDVGAGKNAAMLDDMVALGLVGANDRAGPMTMGKRGISGDVGAGKDAAMMDDMLGLGLAGISERSGPMTMGKRSIEGDVAAGADAAMLDDMVALGLVGANDRAGPMTTGRDKRREDIVMRDRAGPMTMGKRGISGDTAAGTDAAMLDDMVALGLVGANDRAGPMTSGRDFSLLGAPELQNPALRTPAAGGAGLATALKEASKNPPTEYEQRVARTRRIMEEMDAERERAAAPPSKRQQAYEAGRAAGPDSVVEYFTRTVEEQKAIDAANAAASEPAVTAQPADAETPRPKARPTGAVEDLTAPSGGGGVGGAGGAGGSGSGGVGGMGGGAAGPQTDYEKAITDALARTEKRAEQDKWMALAQAGLALMSSNNPTLAGALGEAGAAGLGAFQSSRDSAEKSRMDLLATQYQMDVERQKMAMARAQAAGGGGRSGGLSVKNMFDIFGERVEAAQNAVADARMSRNPDAEMQAQQRLDAALNDYDNLYAQLGATPVGGSDEEVEDVTQ